MAMTAAERTRRYRERHPERARASRLAVDAVRDNAARARRTREADPAKRLAYNARNLHRHAAQEAKRRAVCKLATPAWADMDAIRAIYAEAQRLGMHVDHIEPLRGRNVCGLHVANNLRLLAPLDNLKKGNRQCATL